MIALARRLLVMIIRVLLGARSDWRGVLPEPRQRIYFANHSSHFDTLAVIAALPPELRRITHPVAARDYWGGGGLKTFFAVDCLNAVLIDRERKGEGDPLAPVEEVLSRGRSILIFPEGTRGTGEEIASFKAGLFRLAQSFPQAELVPVYLDNLARVMPKGSYLIVPVTCTARFGPPFERASGEDKDAFLVRARAAVEALNPRRRIAAA